MFASQQKHNVLRALRRRHTSSSPPSSPKSSSPTSSSSSSSWIHLRSVLLVVASSSPSSSPISTTRRHLQSPWSRKRRKHALQPKQWKSFFDEDGILCDGGVKFLKKVRSGGIHPSLREEVWPFLLGVYDLQSSKEERDAVKAKNRKEYEKLRKQCQQTYKQSDIASEIKESCGSNINEDSKDDGQVDYVSSAFHDTTTARNCLSPGEHQPENYGSNTNEVSKDDGRVGDDSSAFYDTTTARNSLSPGDHQPDNLKPCEGSEITCKTETESSDSESSEEEADDMHLSPSPTPEKLKRESNTTSPNMGKDKTSSPYWSESFATWQRIIRLDAIRANDEWIVYTPSQAAVSSTKAYALAESVSLKDHNHLEPCRIFHAARLVSILEAYALYDSEIGYCQGMSDLLSPIISVVEDDSEAFWCFVGFMKKSRHNFRLDEVGIRQQLNIVSKIIKGKDSHLYRHLEELQAEDCFFVYRMVVVLFRRELNFEQTLCLWEVMWADQTAIRAGITKSAWGRMRLRAPPTDDLLLYATAACVLQRRKHIIEKYSSMDEILRECNSMAGHLDVWKLLDDAHDLVVTLHDKI